MQIQREDYSCILASGVPVNHSNNLTPKTIQVASASFSRGKNAIQIMNTNSTIGKNYLKLRRAAKTAIESMNENANMTLPKCYDGRDKVSQFVLF